MYVLDLMKMVQTRLNIYIEAPKTEISDDEGSMIPQSK